MKPYLALLLAATSTIGLGCGSLPGKSSHSGCSACADAGHSSSKNIASNGKRKARVQSEPAVEIVATAPKAPVVIGPEKIVTPPTKSMHTTAKPIDAEVPSDADLVPAPREVPAENLAANAQADSAGSEMTYAQAPDFGWVQGTLNKIHSGGGYWVVRYAPFDRIDDYGGNFVLVGAVPPDAADGDTVRVVGRVTEYDRRLNGTKYQIQDLTIVSKGAGLR